MLLVKIFENAENTLNGANPQRWHEYANELFDRMLRSRTSHALPVLTEARSIVQRKTFESVALESIVGSVRPTSEFDAQFHPACESVRGAWVHNAVKRLRHEHLPIVQLQRAGDFYYVIEGHLQISAARAFQQDFIDAVVLHNGE
jgi:hypothetical protein